MDVRTVRDPLKVGLLFHSNNSGNMGIGALTFADMALIRDAAGERPVEFVLLGFGDSTPSYPALSDTPSLPISVRHVLDPRKLFATLRQLDIVVDIGAGDSFSDIYGWRRLCFLLAAKIETFLAKVPLVHAPQTFGPFKSPFWASISERMIAWSALSFSRDEASIQSLNSIKLRKEVELASDVAFALPFTRPKRPTDDGIRVGINVSGLMYYGGYTGRNEFQIELDYPAFTRRLIERFSAEPGVTIHLIPHVFAMEGVRECDYAVCTMLAKEFALPTPPRFRDPIEAKSAISGMDFFLGARMHSCIAAVSSGVACVPIAYSRKFAGLFGALGYQHTVDARELDTDSAVDAVFDGYHRRTALAAEATKATAVARERLDVYVIGLRRLINQIA